MYIATQPDLFPSAPLGAQLISLLKKLVSGAGSVNYKHYGLAALKNVGRAGH
jgi:hypothetical protein